MSLFDPLHPQAPMPPISLADYYGLTLLRKWWRRVFRVPPHVTAEDIEELKTY